MGYEREGQGRVEETRGRWRKAVGEVTGDERMKRKGEVDKAEGMLKQRLSRVAESFRRMIEKNR